MKKTLVFVVTLLAITAMTVGAAASYPNPGTGSTDVRVMNTNTNASDPAANVVAQYINQSGAVEATKNANVPSLGTHDFLASDSGLGDGWVGSMVISSDRALGAVANVMWNSGVGGDGSSAGTYTGFSSGSTHVYLPALYKVPTLSSKISIQNTGDSTANVQINFRDRLGNAFSGNPVTFTIPKYAQHTLDLTTVGFPNTSYLPAGWWDGSAEITSDQPVSAVATTLWDGKSSTYNGLTQADSKLYIPTHYRVESGSTWLIYSALVLQNTTGTAANVTVHYIPRNAGSNNPFDLTITIPAYASYGINTRNGGMLAHDNPTGWSNMQTTLGTWWDGTVVVDSSQPLVGIVNTIWQNTSTAGTYSAVGPSGGATALYVPEQYRVKSGSSWVKYSAAIVQNIGTSSANVTLTYYNPDGSQALRVTDTIAAGAALGYNLRNGGSKPASTFDPLGTNYQGGLLITSSQPLSVVGNMVWVSPTRAGTYNGVPTP